MTGCIMPGASVMCSPLSTWPDFTVRSHHRCLVIVRPWGRLYGQTILEIDLVLEQAQDGAQGGWSTAKAEPPFVQEGDTNPEVCIW